MSEPSISAPEAAESNEADAVGTSDTAVETLVEQDLLVEDVSIDGMCGVY